MGTVQQTPPNGRLEILEGAFSIPDFVHYARRYGTIKWRPASELASLIGVLLERGVVRKQHPEREYKSWRPAAAPPHYYTERFLGHFS